MSKKILWLYHDLLDLYGDMGNLLAIEYRLKTAGVEYEIIKQSISDQPDFSSVDMVYIGSGRFGYLTEAAKHFVKYKDDILTAIEKGTVFLITGSSIYLLGNGMTDLEGNSYEGIGIIDIFGRDTNNMYISDLVFTPNLEGEAGKQLGYGFINTTTRYTGSLSAPLFRVHTGGPPCDDGVVTEGFVKNNLFATFCQGPLLAKNPHLLKEILCRLCGEMLCYDDSLETKALELTVSDMGFNN